MAALHHTLVRLEVMVAELHSQADRSKDFDLQNPLQHTLAAKQRSGPPRARLCCRT